MNTLYDLVTRIDALTANSQQVLNALIRSCVAAGSSSGYKVNKYGVPIELDRADIYHLYDFYQSWQAEGFPSDENEFNSLLARADERWKMNPDDASKLATEAVVKHAMILYMSKEQGVAITNAKATVSDEIKQNSDFWVAKIRESATPMGTISSAPIPLNLRTPLYDENLSVKSFSQFETYLFPMGYHRADIMGTPGNGDDYIAGGRNWTIDATDFLTLNANHILLGINTTPENKLAAYENKYNTISWGNESYAFGNLSLAFGDHSVAQGDGAIVFGKQCYGMGRQSFIAGGLDDQTVLKNTFATNWMNTAVASESFAANWNNTAGGWGYYFTFKNSESNVVQTECEADVTYLASEGICISDKKVSEVLSDSSLYKVICISDAEVSYSRMPFDMKVGDTVVIYGLMVQNDRGLQIPATDLDGYPASAHMATITNITEVYRENSAALHPDYEITLETAIPVPNRYGVWVGGTVSLYTRTLDLYDIDGKAITQYRHEFGERSAVFGHGNAAIGRNQMVVGQMSVPSSDAKFVVGAGSAYIMGEIPGQEPYRSNALVIAEHYSYMKLANGKSYIGLAAARTTVTDKAPHTDKLTLARGTIMHSYDPDTRSSSSVTTDYDNAFLLATGTGEPVARIGAGSSLSPYFTSDYPTSVLQSLQGTAVIASGAYIEAGSDESVSLVDRLLGESHAIGSKDEHGVAIYAQDGIDIRNIANSSGRGINIETCSYLTMSFDTLRLQGMTFRSLPATDSSESFALDYDPSAADGRLESVYWGHGTGASGFYFIGGTNGANARLAFPGNDSAATHSISKYKDANIHLYNSEIYDAGGERYHVASLAIPEANYGGLLVNKDNELMRPCVTTGFIFGVGGKESVDRGHIVTKELPYMSDISMWSAAPASNYGYRVNADGTMTNYIYSSYNYSSGDTGITVAMPVMELDLAGGGWTESNTYAAYYATINEYKYHTERIVIREKSSSTILAQVFASASIVGNTMDITGYFVLNSTGSWTKDGLRVPLIPGFAVQSLSEKFGSAGDFIRFTDYMYKNNYGLLVSCLSGNHSTNGNSFLGYSIWGETADNRSKILSSEIRFGGVAVSAGIVTVDMYRISHNTDWVSATTAPERSVHPYGFHISGPVPFETVEECLGANINTGWTNAMDRCYKGKIICPKTTLVNILGNN